MISRVYGFPISWEFSVAEPPGDVAGRGLRSFTYQVMSQLVISLLATNARMTAGIRCWTPLHTFRYMRRHGFFLLKHSTRHRSMR